MKTVQDVQNEIKAGMAADLAQHNRKMAVIAEIRVATANGDYAAIKELTKKLHKMN